jgi:hypothetical protein
VAASGCISESLLPFLVDLACCIVCCRDAKRNELLEARRRHSAPVVVAILPLSNDVDPAPLWAGLLAAAGTPAAAADGSLCTILAQGRRRVRLTLLPAPVDRDVSIALLGVGSFLQHVVHCIARILHGAVQVQ